MINTLEIFEELKASSLTEPQSRAILRAVQLGVEEQISNLVTKPDLQLAFQELKNDIQSVRHETHQEFILVRHEIGALRQEMKQEIAAIRQEVKQEIASLQSEIQRVSSDLEMRLIKYIFAQGVVVIGTVITVLHFLK